MMYITVVFVLIETYWNVNVFKPFLLYKCTNSINRNILECKLSKRNVSIVH